MSILISIDFYTITYPLIVISPSIVIAYVLISNEFVVATLNVSPSKLIIPGNADKFAV
jgi:hypothetical protein